MKVKTTVHKYRRNDGTPVKTHTRKIDVDVFKPERQDNIFENKDDSPSIEIDNNLIKRKKEIYNEDNNPEGFYPSDEDAENESEKRYGQKWDNLGSDEQQKITDDLIAEKYIGVKRKAEEEKKKKGVPRNKTIRDYADISLYESIGRYKVGVESDNGSATETYVAKYEAEERYNSIEEKSDVKSFLIDNNSYEE